MRRFILNRSILKNLTWVLILLMSWGCEEYENPNVIPEDRPRLNEVRENYKSILIASEQGWKAIYQPDNTTGEFTILMKFNSNGTVDLKSDLWGYQSSEEPAYYDVKGATFPELVFETFSVWHQLYEEANGEFQFRILAIDEAKVTLGIASSTREATELVLVKASEDDYRKIENTQKIVTLIGNFQQNTEEFFKVIEFPDAGVQGLAIFDFNQHILQLNYIDNQQSLVSTRVNYRYDDTGIVFLNPLQINGSQVNRFNILKGDDNTLDVFNDNLKNGSLYPTELPDFDFPGAIQLFNQYTFYYVDDYSEALDSLNNQIQEAGAFVLPQIYRNYDLSPTQRFNALTFLIFENTDEFDFYSFFIAQFQKLGEDRIRFHWNNNYSTNIDSELFSTLRDFILFFFDNNGFKIIPYGDLFILVSYRSPEKYLVVVPVS